MVRQYSIQKCIRESVWTCNRNVGKLINLFFCKKKINVTAKEIIYMWKIYVHKYVYEKLYCIFSLSLSFLYDLIQYNSSSSFFPSHDKSQFHIHVSNYLGNHLQHFHSFV